MVIETDAGVVLMDPHAAHERVLFDEYMAKVAGGRPQSQGLLKAETVELSPQDARRVREALDLLRRMAWELSLAGTRGGCGAPCFGSARPTRCFEIAACLETGSAAQQSDAGRAHGKAACGFSQGRRTPVDEMDCWCGARTEMLYLPARQADAHSPVVS